MSSVGGRQSQFDVWPGLGQRNAAGHYVFAGRSALLVGLDMNNPGVKALERMFTEIGPEGDVTVTYEGIVLKRGDGVSGVGVPGDAGGEGGCTNGE